MIITFVLTIIITSIFTIVITIIITYCRIKKYNRSDENTDEYYTDIHSPRQIIAIYEDVEEQRDPTTTNDPSYQPTILRTEV